MRSLTTPTRTHFMRWLTSRRLLLIIALVGLAALMASPELKMSRPVKAASTWTVCAMGCNYTTISAAISNASTVNGDTIMVSAGTYTENVVLNKMLTLKGAQAGVGACGRSATETIIMPSNSAIRTLELVAGSAGSIIDGFTFSGGSRQIESTSGPINNLQILNNRFVGFTANAIFLNDNGTDITLNQNSIDGASKTGAGDLIHLDTDSFLGFQLTNNCINGKGAADTSTGFFVDGNHNVGVSATPRTPLISGNTITNCQTGMNLGTRSFTGTAATNNGTISNNTFNANLFDGLQGGIQNTTISGNTFSNNGRHGLALTSFGNAGADRGGQNTLVKGNLMSGNGFAQAGAGLFFASTQAVGTIETNHANLNRIVGNNIGAQYGSSVGAGGAATIDVENNWWGCNKGPGDNTGAGCMGTVNNTLVFAGNTGSLDANPWLVLGITAMPNPINVGGMSNLTADLTRTQTNVDTSGSGNIPNGTPVAFAGTLGTVMPPSTSTTSGKANSVFTGTMMGMGSASTTVDMQTVSTPITIQCPAITVNPATLPNGSLGVPYNQMLTATGGAPSYTFTVPPNTLPPGLTLSSAGTLSGTPTTAGSFTFTVTATDAGGCTGTRTYTVAINSLPVVKIADPAGCLGPGGIVGVTVTVTNSAAAPQNVSVTATLPPQLQSLQNSCAANVGSFTNCNGGLTVAWAGTLAPGQTATLTYLAQVADGTPPGTQLCINTSATFGGGQPSTVQACTTVNCPVAGPGTAPPPAAAVSDQKPGSVLFYNIYTSNPADLTRQNTRINITNTHPSQSAVVHLFFVDGSSCTPADSFICLTPSQTLSFTAADVDPGTTGYIVAVASDPVTGCPINFNFLIGDEFVKFSSGHAANLGAEAFAALANTLPPSCAAGSNTATLNFDGVSYNPVPRVVAVDNFPSTADGNNTLLILNRVGGNLLSGASTIGSLFGVIYDEAEQPLSFTLASNTCQLRGSLNNSFLRTTQRLETVVSAGRTGWLRLWGVADIGLLGSVINLNANAGVNNFSQGHNLHKLTFTTSATLTIPIIPPGC